MTVAPDLEAIVLACLAKDPAHRPQNAAALRLQLEACEVEPWDSASAERWWDEHEPALHDDAVKSGVQPRTIAVNASRSSTALEA